MKKFFNVIGILCLLWFSFFYTEKTAIVVSELDNIMVKIKEYTDNYLDEPVNALIVEDTIIPGKSGSIIDINKSYKEMKKIGNYDEKLFVYKKIKPKISVDDIYDKYVIGGNKQNKFASIIFIISDNDDIFRITKILDKYNLKGTFFVDGYWFGLNNESVSYLINNNHVLGNLSYGQDYSNSGFIWMDTIIKKGFKQNKSYCLNGGVDELKYCSLQKNHIIKPKLIVHKNPGIDICNNLENNVIIGVDANEQLYKELDLIINCIKNKDLKLVTITELLEE